MSKPKLIVQVGATRFSAFFHRMLEQLGIERRSQKPVTKVGNVKGKLTRAVLRNKARKQISYLPGTLGLSDVSEAILKDHGVIMSRADRKGLSRWNKKPFKAYYNA
jgi:hypothetical protein